MSNNTVVKVQVEALSKFGYKDSQGFVSYSKNCSEHDKGLVVPGASFEAEIYTAPSGARYLNKIVARAPHVDAPKAQESVVDTDRAKHFTPKFEKKAEGGISAGLSKDEWAAKDKRISRQGCIQVAVQVQSSFEEAVKLSDKMLAYVNEA